MAAPPLDKREDRIRRMFGAIAPRYDLLNHLLSLNVDRYWRWRTTRLVPPHGDGPILDVCTGTGDLALAYDRAARRRVPIVGADFCLPMLVPAVDKTRKRRAGERIRYVQADAQRLPFPDGTFQLTGVAFGLRNVTDTDRGIAEMVRVTRPGGRVAILEFSRPRHWLFGRLYRAYFRWVLPAVGQLVSRSRRRLRPPGVRAPPAAANSNTAAGIRCGSASRPGRASSGPGLCRRRSTGPRRRPSRRSPGRS